MWAQLLVDGTLTFHAGIPKLAEIQHVVSVGAEPGYDLVEPVEIDDDGTTMWINEEGKYCGVETNEKATWLADKRIMHGDRIMGDVLFTGGADEDGETTSLSEAWAERLRDFNAHFKVITFGGGKAKIV